MDELAKSSSTNLLVEISIIIAIAKLRYHNYMLDQELRLLNVSFCWKRRLQFERGHCLTLSPLKPSYDGHSSGNFQKFAVYTVLELCTHCRYQHMRIELLFHMVSLICCLEVHLVQ